MHDGDVAERLLRRILRAGRRRQSADEREHTAKKSRRATQKGGWSDITAT